MQKYQKQSISGLVSAAGVKRQIRLSDEQVENLKDVGSIILALAGAAGILTLSVVAPNALKLINSAKWLKKTFRNRSGKSQQQSELVARGFYYLKSRGYIKLLPKGKDFLVEVTEKGRKKILKMDFQTLRVKKPGKWDGQWWFVLADIPTLQYRSQADLFRRKLKDMRFFPLQRTVWAYPYDPREEIAFISAHYGIDRFSTVLQARLIDEDDEKKLKNYFKSLKLI